MYPCAPCCSTTGPSMAASTPQALYDFRSDTVTRPTSAMVQAMCNAQLGDDVFRDDPTVHELEARTAELEGLSFDAELDGMAELG